MENMDHNAHSVYLMYYHLIMVVKYRRKVINDPISERAKEIWEYIAPRYGIVLEEWNHDIDHVHVMFRAQPKTELSKFINAYKSANSRLLKKEYPEIREKLWKEAFWSQSFCLNNEEWSSDHTHDDRCGHFIRSSNGSSDGIGK